MKKLYASLAVIAAASLVSASAGMLSNDNLPTKDMKMVQRLENPIALNAKKTINPTTAAKIIARNASLFNHDRQLTAAPAYITASETAGDWTSLYKDIWVDNPNLYCAEEVIISQSGDDVIIDGLGEFYELTGTNNAGNELVYAYYNGGIKATIDGNKMTIAGDQNFGYITVSGSKYAEMYICPALVTEEDGEYSASMQDGDVTFTYDGTNWVADSPFGVYEVLTSGNIYWWSTHFDVEIVQSNTTFTGALSDVDFEYRVYCKVDEDDYGKYLFSSTGSPLCNGYCVYFDIDEDEMTATAIEAIIEDENQTYYEGYGPFYLTSAVPDWSTLSDGTVYLTYVKYMTLSYSDDQKSFWYTRTLDFDNQTGESGRWTVMNYDLSTDEGGFWYGNCDGFYLEIDGAAGVNDIAADKIVNASANVEYFNIMGQKVTNPAAGTIVIKRQGSEVTKMIVR